LLSLAHDVGCGGLATGAAEAAEWSGVAAELDLPGDARVARALVACAPGTELDGVPLRLLGVVG
jgi:hypothetical protein